MTRHAYQRAALGFVIAAMLATTPHAQQRIEWTPALTPVTSPAAPASAQPQLSVSSRGVLLSWIERDGPRATLKFAERTSAGWSAPQTVASGDNWFVNWADVPSVVRLANGTLAAHWLQKSGPETYAYDVQLAYSTDDGRTWSPSFLPHHDGKKREHGFASLFQMPGAGLGLVWLDGREMTSAAGHGAHDANQGAMTVRFASFDTKWNQTADMPIDLRVCECCPTTAAVTSDGPIAAFRNRTEDEVRDIYISRFENGKWTVSKAVHDDGWNIPACPVNGPMLSARGRDVAIAWFTMRGDEGHVFAAFSKDAGRTFGPPIRLDDNISLGRVDIELLDDGSAIATWIEFAEQKSQFRARRVHPSGSRSASIAVAALAGGRAWTDTGTGTPRVQTAVAMLPGHGSR
jgi:hypothetical protein